MLIVRIAKILLVGALASYALIVAYDNIVDYGSNYQFVRRVLSMDTTFPDSALIHRAVTNERVWSKVYALIIAWEWLTSALLAVGALALLVRLRSPAAIFNRAKIWAVAGLMAGFVLWFCGGGRRILCDVAIANVERAGGGVQADDGDSRRANLRRFARKRLMSD